MHQRKVGGETTYRMGVERGDLAHVSGHPNVLLLYFSSDLAYKQNKIKNISQFVQQST